MCESGHLNFCWGLEALQRSHVDLGKVEKTAYFSSAEAVVSVLRDLETRLLPVAEWGGAFDGSLSFLCETLYTIAQDDLKSLYSPGCPQIPGNPPASASQILD